MGTWSQHQDATKIFRQGSKEGCKGAKGRSNSRKEGTEAWSKREEAKGELWDLHLQGPEASTSSNVSLLNLLDLPTTTSAVLYQAGKFKLLFDFFCQESWPSMLCLKEPRRLQSIHRQNNLF